MNAPLKMGMVGVGRIGVFHARHIQELAQETGQCELLAVVDQYGDTAERVAEQLQPDQKPSIKSYTSVDALVEAGGIDAAMIASRTEDHVPDARPLVETGHCVLLEKPLTNAVETAQEFVNFIHADDRRKQSIMLAFMRRFDGPLQMAKDLLEQNSIGRVFKYVSILEDPIPPPDGYSSPGLLIDMSVHNIDEILWLHGQKPEYATALGVNLYNQTISSVQEDFDDAFLQMWFPDNVLGQIMVSRNHVAGYRNVSWIYGDKGHIQVGHFQEDPLSVTVEAYGPQGVIAKKTFTLRDYGSDVPVFITRFGEAYKAELTYFVNQCLNGSPFSVTHEDGLAAQQIAVAGTQAIRTKKDAAKIDY